MQQQAGRGVGVVGVFFDQGTSGQDGGLVDLVDRYAVVQIAHGLGDDGVGADVGTQAGAGAGDQVFQVANIERHALAAVDDVQGGLLAGGGFGLLGGALLGAALAIQHIGTGDLVVATAHQAQFDRILHVFDVEGAAARTRAHHGTHHGLGERIDGLAHAGGGGALGAVDGQEGLHHGDGDLVRLKRHDGAVAANDLVVGQRVAGAACVNARVRGRSDGAGTGLGSGGALGRLHGSSCRCGFYLWMAKAMRQQCAQGPNFFHVFRCVGHYI